MEHRLSVIENPKPHGKSYNKWLGGNAKPCQRDLLRAAIDAAISKAREKARQLQIYKANAEMLLRTDADDQRQTRERQQKNSTAMQGAAEREQFVQSGAWGEFLQQAKGDFRMPEISLFVKFV